MKSSYLAGGGARANPPDVDLGTKPDNEELEATDMESASLDGRESSENVQAKKARAQKIREDAKRKARALRE